MKRYKGMTLIEVLVALMVFATASISVLRSVSQHINTLSHLEEKTFASWVVDNQIALTMLSGKPPESQSGEVEFANQTWYWRVTPIATEENIIAAFDVTAYRELEMQYPVMSVRSYVPVK